MNTIPTCIARTSLDGQTMSVYRTATGRLAVERAVGARLELFDTVDELVERIPHDLAAAVRSNLAAAAA